MVTTQRQLEMVKSLLGGIQYNEYLTLCVAGSSPIPNTIDYIVVDEYPHITTDVLYSCIIPTMEINRNVKVLLIGTPHEDVPYAWDVPSEDALCIDYIN